MERVFAICVIGLALLLGGCAHTYNEFYDSAGKICAALSSTVLGKGETELTVASPCAIMKYATKGTGISKNATELGGKISEGLAKGAVKGLVPVP
jgi:hypothetical protein